MMNRQHQQLNVSVDSGHPHYPSGSGGAMANASPVAYDSSQNYGAPGNEASIIQHEASLVERFMTRHQDATLDKNQWVPDNKVNMCTKCRKNFTFFYRKHHCRICGNVFCNNCTLVKNIVNYSKQESVRMCETCESDLEFYNNSLKTKNNLLNANQRHSFMHSNNDSAIVTGSPDPKAPRNNSGQHQEDAQSVDSDKESERFADQLNEDERRQREEDLRRQTILNQADQPINVVEYIRNMNEDEKTERTFSENRSVISGMAGAIEASIRHRLREFSVHHIQQIVSDIIRLYQIDQRKWGAKLLDFVQAAVDNVRPSSRYLNDSMNFNSFIKIKIINWGDNSKSAYINGVVISKNIADKRMESNIKDPQILLLKESVGTVRSEGAGLTEIQSLVDQEDHWIDIIRQKLTQVRPNIIIVEKDVGYKILDVLRESKITVITNLGPFKMKRIQRYTQTIISPSYNVIDKSFVLGKCKQFRVEAPFLGSQMQRMQLEMMDKKREGGNFVSNDKSLIYFEGTNPALGCTILISGNLATEIDELKKVKQALREMLKLARNVVLERAFLSQVNCSIPKPVYDEKGQIVASESPFLVTRNIQNRQTLVMSKVIMKKGVVQGFSLANAATTPISTPATALNQNNLNASQINLQGLAQAEMDQSAFNNNNNQNTAQFESSVSPQVLQMAHAADKEKVNENYVKTKIDSMCGCPKKEKMTFYGKDQDETIGKFLYRMSKMFSSQCDQCKELMFKHLFQYYHKEGCLEIQIESKPLVQAPGLKKDVGQSSSQALQLVDKKMRDIIMRGECQICKRVVTKDIPMSNTFYEYSKARFLEQFFYNGDRLYNNSDVCSHRSLKDLNRVFVMPGGYQITFSYKALEVYQIEMIQPKKQDTRPLYKQEIEYRKARMIDFCNHAYLELKSKMQQLLKFRQSEKRSYLSKEQQKRLEATTNILLFIDPLNRLKERLSPLDPSKVKEGGGAPNINPGGPNTFESDLTHMIMEIQKPIQDVKTIFEAMYLERKLLINFLTYSKILEETSKVVCLLLALLRLRMIVIQNQQNQDNTGAAATSSMNQNTSFTGAIDLTTGESGMGNSSAGPMKTPDIERLPPSLIKGLSAQPAERNAQTTLLRRGSTYNDHPLMDSVNSTLQTLSTGIKEQPLQCFFIEDFITGAELRQMQQAQQTPALQGGAGAGGGGASSSQPYPSGKVMTAQLINAQNIETVKSYIIKQYTALYDKLQRIWGQSVVDPSIYSNPDKAAGLLFSHHHKQEEEEKTLLDQSGIRGSSIHQNIIQQPKSQVASSIQNITQINLFQEGMLYNGAGSSEVPYQQQWQAQLDSGFVTMPLGTDSVHIPLNDSNIGSIISFILASNIYKEAMIKQNYMDIGAKIKAPSKRQQVNPGGMDPSASQDNLRGSVIGGLANPLSTPLMSQGTQNLNAQGVGQQTQNNPSQQMQPLSLDESIKLVGRDDVFNFELSPHQIETELLCGERLYFQMKFSTEKRDLTLNMAKNSAHVKLKQTSMTFQTGHVAKVRSGGKKTTLGSQQTQPTLQQNSSLQSQSNLQQQQPGGADSAAAGKKRREEVVLNDLQERVCGSLSKDYMDPNNPFFIEQIGTLDSVVALLNKAYFNSSPQLHQPPLAYLQQQTSMKATSPLRTVLTMDEIGEYQIMTEPMSAAAANQLNSANLGASIDHGYHGSNSNTNLRESVIQNIRSPPLASLQPMASGSTPNLAGVMSPALGGGGVPMMNPGTMGYHGGYPHYEPQEFCGVRSPLQCMLNPHDTLKSELKIPRVDYEVKIFFPKKFEALRRFYCGSQYDFIESLIRTQEWTTVTGGKTKSKFYRSFDDKYVFKEIKKSEFKMFIEFAPSYFDYLCKSFFHNYPCALCKILGAFKIKVTTYKGGTQKITKKHIYITENLNFGIKPEDEPHIIRYDLKGSTLNRFVKKQVGTAPTDLSRVVLHDNNFQLAFMGRPLPIRYTINRILHICINNDTLCLSKSNIVDYSLLTIIDARRKKVRFGIIDYVQQYTLDKIFEGQFKRIINRGEVPTIVDPDKYKMRFKRAMKRYFIGMVTQEEKAAAGGAEGGPACSNKQEQLEMLLQQQLMAEDHDSDDEITAGGNELNDTINGGIKQGGLNDTFSQLPKLSGQGAVADSADHDNVMLTGSEKDHLSVTQASPALQ